MTAEEFKKYEGKRTTGRVSGYDLRGGIIIGYTDNTYPNELLAIDENNGWTGPHWAHKAIIPNKEHEKDYINGKKNYLWVTVDNVIMDEQKELDLTKILRGCEGVELWSDICGKCVFTKSDNNEIYVRETDYRGYSLSFLNNGKYDDYPSGKCLLWPSETNRDWSTFKKPVRWVVCSDNIKTGGCISREDEVAFKWKYVIPFDKFRLDLTEEELKKLSIV